ncbi:YbfB/YjiJ family MFS transporter [Xylophilus sp.]|uniref:YbfB/YjiJ family MFS transporter n=1 Tax=Xylophilus sp. TaxID=2653893 RepID=UPI0013B5DCAC|nr:YbfB/YjiJ family MFS transporter [Xylophilus sp.]KAF1048797.1 MAG: hypothetical protein GAK38_01241 [Xylophilus sp.]
MRAAHPSDPALPWPVVGAAFCASLVGIGLARFAYTPLLPALVGAHWFDAADAAYLGAANLAGYLAGALLGRPMAARVATARLLRGLMLLAAAAFAACAAPVSFGWFFVWRFAAGLAGGGLMVLAAPTVLAGVPLARRGLAGGLIFMGVGTGVAIAGTLVPLLLQRGVRAAWLGLALLSLALTAAAWAGWPRQGAPAPAAPPLPPPRGNAPVWLLYGEYALNVAGWVPHMVFFVDFIARGLGRGVAVGAHYWIVFGLGATAGPVLAGAVADRIGFGRTLRLGYAIEGCAVLLPVLSIHPLALGISALVVGAFVTGTVPLVLGRVHELLPGDAAGQRAAWSRATAAFALLQAAAAYALSFVFARSGGSYALLFGLGTAAVAAALVTSLVSANLARRG